MDSHNSRKLSYDDSTVQRVARAICKEFEGCDGCPGRERCGNQWKAGPEGEHAGLVYDDEMERLARAALAALAQQAQDEEIRPLSPNDSAEFKDGFNQGILRARDYVKRKLAQQAQPLTDDVERASAEYVAAHSVELFGTVGDFRGTFKSGAEWYRDRMAQQAQSEMPTLEAIADLMWRFFEGRDDQAQRRHNLALDTARAVRALYAPKETTCTCEPRLCQTDCGCPCPCHDNA